MAPRHAAKADRRRRVRLTVAGGVLVVIAAVAVGVALLPSAITPSSASAGTFGPLHVRSITPTGSPDAPLRIAYNNPLSATSPMPTITPTVAGNWAHLSADVISFRAAVPMTPGTSYAVTVPATTKQVDGQLLRTPYTRHFRVPMGTTLRLNQVLAELGYLPLRFVPTGPVHPASAAVQRGTFTWRWPSVPVGLSSLWQPGAFTVMTRGALMSFENDHNFVTDGVASPQVWDALLRAVAKHDTNKNSYGYVDVNTAIPQTLTLYVNLRPIYHTLVNTGISSRPTALGTYPVYVRYLTTTMSGTNPDGSHYSDPGIPWVSYFNGGDALHGFIRGSYGWPQSLGCVEMPFANAHTVFPYTPIGTLVTVR
ncbi:MAG TPA: L,D-transpeptidase [Acidimicrobiales bacterium]|jgi:lipoprotein-anchoring transpeptidase ErfK/SrfK|nr:L,D-transpeptidase [Acidimicrobiales bacterium]